MSLIKFFNSDNILNVNYYVDSYNRIHLKFNNVDDIPNNEILLSGFVELNEHNNIIQSDYRDYIFLYKSDNDNATFILTNKEDDIYVEPTPTPEPEPYVPTEEELQTQFEMEKENKIAELSADCQLSIYKGIDVDNKHYSYTLQDQTNLVNAINTAKQSGMEVPYHADGESCKLYSADELQKIYVYEQSNLTQHQTYFNQMKQYINNTFVNRAMLDELHNIHYGTELTGEYLDAYNTIIEHSMSIISVLTNNNEANS